MVTGIWKIAAKFAIFLLVAILLFMVLVNTMVRGVSDAREFTAQFSDVSGLKASDEVKVAGVRVGEVKEISVGIPDDGIADVTFELRGDQPLLDNTRIVMRYQDLIGQRYLSLSQPAKRGAELEEGAEVPLARTSPGFDLTTLLNGFRPLFQVLEPKDVNKLATSMVKVLQGEGGTVEQLLKQTANLTGFVADRDQLIGEVLDNLTPVLNDLAGQGTELKTTVRELESLMAGLARDRKSIGASIDGVSQLVGSTSQLLRDLRQPTTVTLEEFRKVAKTAANTKEELNAALVAFRKTMGGLGRASSYENAVNVYVCTTYLVLGENLVVNPGGGAGPWSEVCRG